MNSTQVGVAGLPAPDRAAAPLTGADLYINRELSWLDFNQRVLDQAFDDTHPLLERVKFLAIVGSNLDEFFMVRVATLLRAERAGHTYISADGLTLKQQLTAIRSRARTMMSDQAACWHDRLRPALAAEGVRFLDPEDYTDADRHFLAAYFRSEIYPLLTPLAFDPGHPFPLISNRSQNFAVVVQHGRRRKFARVKVPALLPRFVALPRSTGGGGPSPHTFALLEDVMRMNLGELFPGVTVVGAHLFRVIRDSDLELTDAADDLLETIDRSLKLLRYGPPSLLQVESTIPARVLQTLVQNFEVKSDVVMRTAHRLNFGDWMSLYKLPLPSLKDAAFVPRTLWDDAVQEASVFDEVRNHDLLAHHPFDSFDAVETFLEQAVHDPAVAGIKMTLYRIAPNSPLIDLLIEAADAGKQVAVLVELKARFDERNNIQWATRLEEAGVHVVYGVERLKTHCKLCLVVRQEPAGVTRYAHIGTGNYNRLTSQVYTDVSLFTADPAVLDDVSEVFNALTGYSQRIDYRELLVAPGNLRERLHSLFEREAGHARAGRPARIIIKNNALTDADIIAALYRTAQAGVAIDLIVRGVCCLQPGVPGVSDRIRVRSIVGRFLEHSRLYYFENGGDPVLYFGSADLMERNLDRRVETLCRIRDTNILRELRDVVLDAYLRDNTRAYELVDGAYRRVTPAGDEPAVNAQRLLLDWYRQKPAAGDDPQFLA